MPKNLSRIPKFIIPYRYKKIRSGQLAVMRSGWRDPNALFAAIKGTDDNHQANTFHRHTNTGTFFLQALGEEWAMDLGQESYLVKDYDTTPRVYYKLRAEGIIAISSILHLA